jgi:hypothetical protein
MSSTEPRGIRHLVPRRSRNRHGKRVNFHVTQGAQQDGRAFHQSHGYDNGKRFERQESQLNSKIKSGQLPKKKQSAPNKKRYAYDMLPEPSVYEKNDKQSEAAGGSKFKFVLYNL